MKKIFLLLSLGVLTTITACKKESYYPATGVPETLNYLIDDWIVVDYHHQTDWGVDIVSPPAFDAMKFTDSKLSLFLDDVLVIKNKKIHIEEKEGYHYITFAPNGNFKYDPLLLSHHFKYENDTLYLFTTAFDAGTNYKLVKK